VHIDAVGNVVGRYKASKPGAKTLLTGSHYDTVRNGGKYDGRLGIFTPMACVRELSRQGGACRSIEVIAFAEEEGQRYKATFLGSGALIGSSTRLAGPEGRRWHHHARGHASTPACARWTTLRSCNVTRPTTWALWKCTSSRARCSTRWTCRWASSPPSTAACATCASDRHGQPRRHHAHEPPPRRAVAVAELALYMEQRAAQDGDSVGTIGI
jgi:N-carbamoyl-L-amino-acid hydrolase